MDYVRVDYQETNGKPQALTVFIEVGAPPEARERAWALITKLYEMAKAADSE